MTVSSISNTTTATAGTGAAQTIAFTFPVTANTEVKVKAQNPTTGAITTLVKDTHYTVTLTGSGTPNYTGGSITTLTPFQATSVNLTVYRVTTQSQAYDPINNDAMDAESLEAAIDKLFMLIADVQAQVNRCVQIPVPETSTVELPDIIDRASEAVSFDASGDVTTA